MNLFSPPTVVAFAGHMIDKPDRPLPRFPASIEASIKQAIIHSLHTLQARIGYCSLACGGDILFAEAMAEAGGEVNLFLPFGIEDFLNTSINFAGTQWADRFHALLNKYPVSFITTDHYLGYDDLFSYQSKIIFGSAVLRSTSQHNEPTLLTVLSEVDLKRQEGGTRDTLRLWPFPQHHVNINPDIFISQHASVITASSPTPITKSAEKETEKVSFIRPVLYIVYCELSDTLPVEREKVIKTIHSTIEEPGESLKYFNLEKDGILIMFDAQASAEALVRLIHDSLVSINAHSVCKISLHAGPVYLEEESNQLYAKAYGESVELVKKLSAIALPGTVCASTNFAALLALNEASYTLEYSGILHTDDTSHSFPVYKVGFKVKY
jgi:class 3 adenylate cyclase